MAGDYLYVRGGRGAAVSVIEKMLPPPADGNFSKWIARGQFLTSRTKAGGRVSQRHIEDLREEGGAAPGGEEKAEQGAVRTDGCGYCSSETISDLLREAFGESSAEMPACLQVRIGFAKGMIVPRDDLCSGRGECFLPQSMRKLDEPDGVESVVEVVRAGWCAPPAELALIYVKRVPPRE